MKPGGLVEIHPYRISALVGVLLRIHGCSRDKLAVG